MRITCSTSLDLCWTTKISAASLIENFTQTDVAAPSIQELHQELCRIMRSQPMNPLQYCEVRGESEEYRRSSFETNADTHFKS